MKSDESKERPECERKYFRARLHNGYAVFVMEINSLKQHYL